MTPFGDTVQEKVDSYEDKGLATLLKMQQQNPKLLAGIAVDNLVADVESGNAQKVLQSGMGMAGQPSVLDRQATALADGTLLNAASRVGPGIQQRGNQIAQQQRYPGQQPGVGGQPGMGGQPGLTGRQPAQNQRRAAQPGMRMNMQARNPAIGSTAPTGMPALRSNLPRAAAQGGIIGYEEGGDVDGGWWEILKEADRKRTAQRHEEQQLRREQGRSIRDYVPFMEPKGQLWIENALYDASRGIGSLLNKRRPEAGATGSAVLSETDTFRRATEILNNPESTDEQKAFARMQLEGLQDAPMRAEMLQQVDKINAARGATEATPLQGIRQGMAGGGIVSLAQGGLLGMGDTTEEGEVIVAMAGPNGDIPVTDKEFAAFFDSGTLPANRNAPSKTRLPAALSAIEDLGQPIKWARQELESRAKEGSLEQELLQGNILTGPATGNVLGGEGGFSSDIRKIAEDPSYDSWQKILGGSTVATGEALSQAALKGLGGGWAGVKYGFKSGLEALGGGSQRIDEITMETRQANMSRIDSEFDNNITRLQTALQELQADSDFLSTLEGQTRLQELQEQIAATREEHRAAIKEIVDLPLPSEELQEGYSGIRGRVLDWMKGYEDDPESTWIGNLLGQVRDSGFGTVAERAADAQQIEVDREAISAGSEEAISSQRGTTTDDEYRLGMAARDMFTPPGGAITPETPEQTGGIDSALTTDPNVWDQVMRISNVLGKGAGASKGWEGINIAKGMQQERALEAERGFEADQLQRQMDARLDLARMGERSALQIAKADAMVEARAAAYDKVYGSEAFTDMEKELQRDYDVFFGGYSRDKRINGLTYGEALDKWVEEKVNDEMIITQGYYIPGGNGDVLGAAEPEDFSDWGTVGIEP